MRKTTQQATQPTIRAGETMEVMPQALPEIQRFTVRLDGPLVVTPGETVSMTVVEVVRLVADR